MPDKFYIDTEGNIRMVPEGKENKYLKKYPGSREASNKELSDYENLIADSREGSQPQQADEGFSYPKDLGKNFISTLPKTSLQPFGKGKPLMQTIEETREKLPVSADALFNMAVDRYKSSGNWIKEVENDPDISERVKNDLTQQYRKHVKLSDDTIETKDLPPAAKEWLERNKVSREVTQYMPSNMGGGTYTRTVRENTPEQIAFIKDFIANGSEGMAYARAHKDFVGQLEGEANTLLQQIEDIRETSKKNKKAYAEKHDISTWTLKGTNHRNDGILDKAANLLKNTKLLLSSNKEGGGFWKGLHMTNEDIKELAVLTESFYNDKVLNQVIDKYQKDPNSLSKEETIVIQAKYIADQIAAGVDPGSWYNIGASTKQSLPFMRDFILTAPIGGGAANVVKGGASALARKTGANIALSRGIGSTVSNLGKGAIDLSVRPAVQTMFSPSSYAMAFQEMQGQGVDRDDQGNIAFDNRKSFKHGMTSAFIENQSEVMGEVVLDKLFQKFKIPLPGFLKTNAAKRLSHATGIQQPISEYAEEKYADLINIVRGEETIEGFFDPRQNLETFGAVAIMQIPFTTINATGYSISKIRDIQAKKAIKSSYDLTLKQFDKEFGQETPVILNTLNSIVDSQNETDIQNVLINIIDDPDLTNEQKRAASEYVVAYSAYSGINKAKQEQVEEVKKEVTSMIEENVNPQMGAVVSAIISGYDGPMQVVGGNILLLEDGSIDRVNSDKQIFYLDPDGNKQVTSIDFVEGVAESIPTEEAINQVTEMESSSLMAELENEEVREYEAGEIVSVDLYGNGVLFTGEVAEQYEDGNYVLVDRSNGQTVEVEPRQIINQDNIRGVENGSLVEYKNNGKIVQGTVNDAYGLRSQGMMDIDGNGIPIGDIIGLVEQTEVSSSNKPDSIDTETTSNQNEQAFISSIDQIPKNESGTLLFEHVPVDTTIHSLTEVYPDASELSGVVDATISNIEQQIEKAKHPKPTGDITKDIANKQAANQELKELENRLNYWHDVRNNLQENKPSIEVPAPEPVIQKPKKTKKATSFQRRLNLIEGNVHSLRDRILFGIASGSYKFRWKDKDVSVGVARELGLSGSEAERKARIGILSNNGYTPSSLAHHIWEETGMTLDDNEIRNEIIDVLSNITSRTQALEELESNIGITEEINIQQDAEAYQYVQEIKEQENALFTETTDIINEQDLLSLINDAFANDATLEEIENCYTASDFIDLIEQLKDGKQEQASNTRRDNGEIEISKSEGDSSESTQRAANPRKRSGETQRTGIENTDHTGEGTSLSINEDSLIEEIAKAEAETNTNPTDAQKEAGNYKKGHVSIQGFDISIEQPKGSVRSGIDENGKSWSVTMHNTYGYFRKTEGKDGDHIDVFLGNRPESRNVFVVDQINPETGVFDEHKVMLGFNTLFSAKKAYLSNYEKGWKGLGAITAIEIEDFRKWTETEGRRIKPFAEYKQVLDTPHITETPSYGETNQIITSDKYEELKQRMRDKLNNLNSGFDPEIYTMGMQMAMYHIEAGGRKFADFAAKMIEDLGDTVRPFLKSFYESARQAPGMETLRKHMDSFENVNSYDLDNLSTFEVNKKQNSNKNETNRNTRSNDSTSEHGGISTEVTDRDVREQTSSTQTNDRAESEQRSGMEEESIGERRRSGRSERDHSESSGTELHSTRSGNDRDTRRKDSGDSSQTGKPLNRNNNRQSRDETVVPRGNNAKINANISAIKLAKRLIESGKKATPEQQAILRKYTGWGGLSSVFKPEDKNYKALKDVLTEEEYESARASTTTAFYTPPQITSAVWDIIEKLGFKGGNILEPSAGIGNFFALMPEHISTVSHLRGIELDTISGNILKLLYPDANIHVSGFEKQRIANNSMDLVVSNVPFGNFKVYDTNNKDISNQFDIHDFFIAKSIRTLKAGGIGIFITTSSTLDKSSALRNWVINNGNADFIDAVRLNTDTFKNDAGTEATADIIVVRKRDNKGISPYAKNMQDSVVVRETPYTQKVKDRWGYNAGEVEKKARMTYNKFFLDNPHRLSGEMKFGFEGGNDIRPTEQRLAPVKGVEVQTILDRMIAELPDDIYNPTPITQESKAVTNNGTKEGGLTIIDGQPYIVRFDSAIPVDWNKNKAAGYPKVEVLQDYIAIKKAVEELLDEENSSDSDASLLSEKRSALNKAYDTFVSKYGYLNDNRKINFLHDDVDFPSISAIENVEEDSRSGERTISKSDIFSKRVIDKQAAPKADNVKDAVRVSINQHGKVDVPYIAKLLNKSSEAIQSEIVKERIGFVNPETGLVEDRNLYLSGNVRDKLSIAQQANQEGEYDTNIEELSKIIPADIPINLIKLTLGSTWIPNKVYNEFFKEIFNVTATITKTSTDKFIGKLSGNGNSKDMQMGMPQAAGSTLALNTMNNTRTVISTYEWRDGKRVTVTDPVATAQAAAKQTELTETFEAWVKQKKEFHAELEQIYNNTFNAIVNPKIDVASFDRFPGTGGKVVRVESNIKSPEGVDAKLFRLAKENTEADNKSVIELAKKLNISYNESAETFSTFSGLAAAQFEKGANGTAKILRQHQKEGVIRGLEGATLLAHEVGTGKTLTLITTAMEMRRLGLAKKPCIVVQRSTYKQFVKEIKNQYPNAKVLAPSAKDLTAKQREQLFAKIAYNDWDIVVLYHSYLDSIPDDPNRVAQYIDERIQEKMDLLAEMERAKEDGNMNAGRMMGALKKEIQRLENEKHTVLNDPTENSEETPTKSKKKRSVKDIEKVRANTEAKIEKALDRRTDNTMTFEQLGMDALLIDEAHAYKKLGFVTSLQRVKGIDTAESKRAQSTRLKSSYILENHNGKNVVLATGTPISNTMAEMWTFMRYLHPRSEMSRLQMNNFDAFVNNFGSIEESAEFGTNGKFRITNRFSSYSNIPELIAAWRQIAHTVLTEEVSTLREGVGTPKLEGGKPTDIMIEQTPALKSVMKAIKNKLEWFDNLSGKEKKEVSYIPLVMFGLAKRAAIDVRLVDPNLPDEAGSKTNIAVKEILSDLEESAEYKGTVAVFCDSYQSSDKRFNVFQEIKQKLIDQGIAAEEIAIINDYKRDDAKEKLFAALNSGDVRVIMGTTERLGVGVNIQERLHELLHLDAPLRPSDYQQRNGRIARQGNTHLSMDKTIKIVRVGVKKTLDVTGYQRLEIKKKFIDQIMKGDVSQRMLEEADIENTDSANFNQMMANLSGSQAALALSIEQNKLKKLLNAQQYHEDNQIFMAGAVKRAKGIIVGNGQAIERFEKYKKELNRLVPEGKVTTVAIGKLSASTPDDIQALLTKYVTKKIDIEVAALREDFLREESNIETAISVNGIKVILNIQVKRNYDVDSKKTRITRDILYTSPDTKVINPLSGSEKQSPVFDGKAGANVLNVIEEINDLLSGYDIEREIQKYKIGIDKAQRDIDAYEPQIGQSFAKEKELIASEKKVEELNAQMQEELKQIEEEEAKENVDAIDIEDIVDKNTENPEDDPTPPGGGRKQLSSSGNFETIPAAKFDRLIDRLNQTGLATDVIIEENIQEGLPIEDVEGNVYGYVSPEGKVYLDARNMNANTPIHEFGHLWNSFIKSNNPDLYNRGIELVKESPYWERVNNNPAYSSLSEEQKAEEALAMAIGDKGEAVTNRGLKERIMSWLSDLWKSVKAVFSIGSKVDVADMTLSDFTDMAVRDLLGGKRLTNTSVSNVITNKQIKENLEQINSTFNSQLQQQIEGNLPKGHTYQLGNPSNILQSAGIPNLPIQLQGSRLADKAMQENHPFDLSEVTDLPKAVQNPLAVFRSATHIGSFVIMTELEHRGKNYVVALEANKRLGKIEVNSIRSVHYRNSNAHIANWIDEGLLEYVDKKRTAEWISKQRYNSADVRKLFNRAANIINNFENPSLDVDNNRYQSVNELAEATGSTMTEEVRNELDRKLKNFRFRLREAWEDRHLAVKDFLDVLREKGVDIADYNDYYKQATHINGKIDAQLEHYNERFQKPLNKSIRELEDSGLDYRSIENYAILKHGLERNVWMRQDAINKFKELHPEVSQEVIDKYAESLPDDYSGITAVQEEIGVSAEEFIAGIEGKTDQALIDNFWDGVKNATQFSLNKQLEGGLIDKKTFDELSGRYEYYIPLRGHDAVVAEDLWYYSLNMGTFFVAPLIKAKGRKTRSESPFAFIFSMAQSSINGANRNILNQTILRLARKDTTGLMGVNLSWYAQDGLNENGEPTYSLQSPTYSENPEQYRKNIEEFEERMQMLAEAGLAYQSGSRLNIGGLFIKRNQADQHAVQVFQNGKEYTVYINANPAVACAINGVNAKDLHKDLRFIARVSRQMAANFTTRNPIFVATNFSRDYIYASSILAVKEDVRYALEFQRNIPQAAGALQRYIRGKGDLSLQQDQYVLEYIMNGGKTGFSHIVELDKIQKKIEREIKNGDSKNVFRSFMDVLSDCNEFAENLSRFSVYITSREQGRNITQSISDAKEVTVNFNRSGAGGYGAAWFRSLYLFVNAGIQGLSNFAKVAQKNPGKTTALISSYVMSGMLMPLLTSLIGGDDGLEDYMKLSEWERQNNLCIYTGNGFIKIPLPHELRVFHAMGDNIFQAVFGRKDVTESFIDILLSFSDLIPAEPMGAIQGSWADLMPDALKPFFQLKANRNFTGSRITNEWADPNKPGYLRVRTNKKGEPFAPAFLVKLAESMDTVTGGDGVEKGLVSFNPDEVNHVLRGYFGGLYTIGTQVVTIADKAYEVTQIGEFKLKVRETPLKTFFASSDDLLTTSSGLNSKYFNIADDLKETRRKIKGYQDQALKGKINTETFGRKIGSMEKDILRYNRLYPYIKHIQKYESALKELDGEDQREAERVISDMKKQVIELNSVNK